jgi:hypothetical protein
VAEGKLPTFARLMREGVFSESLPIPPCDTPTNWTVLQTGAHTGTTEVVSFFTHHPGEPLNVAHATLHSGAVKAELVWEAAERQDKRCILLNWPCSWPSRLKQGIQVNGAGPFTASWRVSFGRVYRQGDLGGRTLAPAILKLVGGLVDDVCLKPAQPWKHAPASERPPLETTVVLLGAERFRWSETGMQVESGTGAAAADPDARTYHILVVDSAGQGYDRAIVARARDAADALADLRAGQWSGWISESFAREKVLQQLVPIAEAAGRGRLPAQAPPALARRGDLRALPDRHLAGRGGRASGGRSSGWRCRWPRRGWPPPPCCASSSRGTISSTRSSSPEPPR